MDVEQFRIAGYKAIDRICDYFYSLEERAVVSTVEPGYLRKALPGKSGAPEEGETFDKIADDFRDLILPGLTHWQHPSFFAYFPTSCTAEGVLGDLYSSSVSNPGFNWACSPACTELEAVVMDWAAKLFGLSDVFFNTSGVGGGVLHTTASDSALTAVVAARSRYTRLHPEVAIEDLVMYVTTQTHSLGTKAALILGLSCRPLEVKPEDEYGLRGDTLHSAILEDKANGKHPFILIATVGTTSTGAIDKLDELGDIVQEHGLWLHVDAAWAGVALACPEYRELCQLESINRYAQSFCTNFHKWGLVNFDASTLWVRDRTLLTDALDVTPEFLRTRANKEGTVIDYRNWQLALGRRFRSLKVWFVLRSYGVQGFRNHLRKGVELANRFSSLLEASSQFELVVRPSITLTVFRLVPYDSLANATNDISSLNLLNRIFHRRLSSTDLFLTQTEVNGVFCIRFAVGAARTQEKHIDMAWKVLCAEAGPAVEEWTSTPT
ncbi:pyridoxal phosphate-dependent transferase [Gautieria morchelliformis]|nr:pyridoxal phosphate-dependent transferase [Gautieria morchelliformis]